MKFATKPYDTTHLTLAVATLPWKIKHSNFLQTWNVAQPNPTRGSTQSMDNSEIDSHLRDCRRRATVGLTGLSTAAKASQNLEQKQQFKS